MTHEEALRQFREETKVSKGLATKIMDALYAKGLDAKDFQNIFWMLRDMFMREELPKLMENAKKDTITKLVDEVVARRARIAECYNDNDAELSLFAPLLFSDANGGAFKEYKEGDIVHIQIMRTGAWNHPAYGKFKITTKTLDNIVKNFKSNRRGIELAVDENHEENHKALAWYHDVYKKGTNAVFAALKLTAAGAETLTKGYYKYFSPEIVFKKQDEESGELVSDLLVGGAFTNRPFFKSMKPLMASEKAAKDASAREQSRGFKSQFTVSFFSPHSHMLKLVDLLEEFSELDTITAAQKTELESAFAEVDKDDITDEISAAYKEMLGKFDEEGAEEKPEAKDDSEEDSEEEDDEEKPEDKPEDKVETPEEVAASEDDLADLDDDAEVTMKASEVRALREAKAELSKKERSIRFSEAVRKVRKFSMSKDGKTCFMAPKDREAVARFSVGLSEQQEAQFWNVLAKMKAVSLSEIGHAENGSGSAVFNEAHPSVKYFMEAPFNYSKEEAIEAAKEAHAGK